MTRLFRNFNPASNYVFVLILAISATILSGCLPEDDTSEQLNPVRGLVTVIVGATDDSITRKYPGVLEPAELNTLSFEVGGKLGRLNLSVGQRVTSGELLAELDSTQFAVAIENREASVVEVEARLRQLREDLARSEQLLERGAGTVVRRDQDATEVREAEAQLVQAQKDLALAQEDLSDAKLFAPFDGIINSVAVDSFATVSEGTAIAQVYEQNVYEVSFSVNFDTVAGLVVGTPATVRLADDPSIALMAVVSELGDRADTVSSFPVVVQLSEEHPLIRAGMAVEVSLEFNIPAEDGFLVPISAAVPDVDIPEVSGPTTVTPLDVFVFDPDSRTVQRRQVVMAGIRENKFLIIEGLSPGDRVASAGVSFLRDGMEVRLLESEE
ncbi:MAG: efflux RND transporter periplasmic adaptor subunit [Pseudomonadota bacterium]